MHHICGARAMQYRQASRRPAGNKKHYTFSSTAGARPTVPTAFGTVIEAAAVRAIFAPPNSTFLI